MSRSLANHLPKKDQGIRKAICFPLPTYDFPLSTFKNPPATYGLRADRLIFSPLRAQRTQRQDKSSCAFVLVKCMTLRTPSCDRREYGARRDHEPRSQGVFLLAFLGVPVSPWFNDCAISD
jgi:hypothetical protein